MEKKERYKRALKNLFLIILYFFLLGIPAIIIWVMGAIIFINFGIMLSNVWQLINFFLLWINIILIFSKYLIKVKIIYYESEN